MKAYLIKQLVHAQRLHDVRHKLGVHIGVADTLVQQIAHLQGSVMSSAQQQQQGQNNS